MTAGALVLGVCVATPPRCEAMSPVDEQAANYLIQYFGDSDNVGVRTSILNYSLSLRDDMLFFVHWNNERVLIPAIEAPAGSQEAVDAITTASRPIASGNAYRDFIKVRNEFQGDVRFGPGSVGYYHSSEIDYLGQQLSASYNRDFMAQQLNVAMGTSYGWDDIKPLADDDTNASEERKSTVHWNAVATHVLTPSTLVRVGLEYNLVKGLQHNPYRNVYAGGTNVAEHHPGSRQRRDAFVKVNQYFDNRSSVRLSYRIYNDDWGISSHEIGTKFSQYVTTGLFARYRYRYYTQSSANFYSDQYVLTTGIGGYLTGDYRMGPLASHLFGFALNFDLDALAVQNSILRRMGVWLNFERYFNSNNYSSNLFATGLGYRF